MTYYPGGTTNNKYIVKMPNFSPINLCSPVLLLNFEEIEMTLWLDKIKKKS